MPSLLILIAACLYGISPILIKVAYAYGVTPLTVLTLRSTLAAVCLWIGLGLAGAWRSPSRSTLVSLLLIGTTLLPVQAFSYFLALAYLPASTASVLVNSYPFHVAWMGWVFLKERVRPWEIAVLIAVVLGAVLVAGQTPAPRGNLAFLLLVVATLLGSVYMVAARHLVRDVSPLSAMAVMVPGSAAAYWCAGVTTGQLKFMMPAPALEALIASALLATLAAPLALLSGLRTIPAVRAAMLGMLEPVVTVGLSVLMLADVMTPLRAAGIALVISGIAVLQIRRAT